MGTPAAVYTRISKDPSGQELGVTRQRDACKQLAARIGADIVEVYSDNDISAWSGKRRPGYEAMLAAIREGRVRLVIAWHQDRLFRTLTGLEEYAALGVPTHFVQSGELDLTSASGRAQAGFVGVMARYESDHKRDRVRAQKKQAAQQGKFRGGRRPFGYEADGITVRESEAQLVREATRKVLAGNSLRSIFMEWNARGITTSMGGRWRHITLRNVLARPRNAGLIEVDGQPAGDAIWPAIVPREEWQALRDLLLGRSRYTAPRGLLGTGLFLCCCGLPVAAGTASKPGIPGYRCSVNTGHVQRPGPHITKDRKQVDDYVLRLIAERLRKANLGQMLAPDRAAETAALEAEAEVLRGRLNGLSVAFANGNIDAEQLSAGSKGLHAKLDQVQGRIAAGFRESALAGIAEEPDPGAAFLAAPVDRQRAIINALCVVTLLRAPRGKPKGWKPGDTYFHPESVQIDWRSQEPQQHPDSAEVV